MGKEEESDIQDAENSPILDRRLVEKCDKELVGREL